LFENLFNHSTLTRLLLLSPLNEKEYCIMNHKFKGLSDTILIGSVGILFLLFRVAKISPIIGSHFAFFSLSDVIMPLTGAVGLWFSIFTIALRVGYKMSLYNFPLSALVYHLPGFCASAYWALDTILIRVILPLLCMVLFIMHPIGYQAAPYSFYWVIPVAIYFFKKRTVFLESLGSTFIAHAVGSVLWLYMFNMSAQMWLALIPVVAIERLFFASTMTVLYSVLSTFKQRTILYSYAEKFV
jgi:hypothetical protein